VRSGVTCIWTAVVYCEVTAEVSGVQANRVRRGHKVKLLHSFSILSQVAPGT
jgi:hypothetical protein